jgi:ferredoxin
MSGLTRTVSRRALFGLRQSFTHPDVSISEQCFAYRQTTCESCADACESGAIQFVRTGMLRRPVIDASRCTACNACVEVCPASAVTIKVAAASDSKKELTA